MLPPPPTEPPSYDLSLIELPTLEPMEKKDERSTKRLGLWHRLASIFCRANGDDHSKRVRDRVRRSIDKARGKDHD